jgi:hypothetical protein
MTKYFKVLNYNCCYFRPGGGGIARGRDTGWGS